MKSFLRDTVLCRRDFFNFLNYNIVKGGLDMVNKYKTVKQLSDELGVSKPAITKYPLLK